MATPRSQQVQQALQPIIGMRQTLGSHPFDKSTLLGAQFGVQGERAVDWKQRMLKDLHSLGVKLDGVGLKSLAQRVEQQREKLEKALDLDAPITVTIALLDGNDQIRRAREARLEQYENSAKETGDVLTIVEQEGKRHARELAEQEQEQQREILAATAEKERNAVAERARAAVRFADFDAAAALNFDRGCAAVVGGIYLRAKDGVARSLAMSVVLVPPEMKADGHVGPSLLDLDGLRAYRVLAKPEDVRGLLAAIRTGRIPCEYLPGIDMPMELGNTLKPDVAEYAPRFKAPARYRAYAGNVLTLTGRRLDEAMPVELWKKLSTRLPASTPPFADTAHLCSALDLTVALDHTTADTYCEVFSPAWVRLRLVEPSIARRMVVVEVETYWSDIEKDATLSIIPLAAGSLAQPPCRLSRETWRVVSAPTPAEPHVFTRGFEMPGPAGPVVVSLNVGSRQVDRALVGNVSTRLVAHDSVDPDLRRLHALLFDDERDNLDAFEGAICVLLHLCGMSAAPYGLKGMERTPDVIAFLDEDLAVFGECTVEPPDAKKMKNLSSRAAAFRTTLEDSYGRSVKLVSTMFVRRPRRAMSTDAVEGALGENVRIAFEEDIRMLFDMAFRGEPATATATFLETLGRPRRSGGQRAEERGSGAHKADT